MNETAMQGKKRANLPRAARRLLWVVLWAPVLAVAQYHAPLTGGMATSPEDAVATSPAVDAQASRVTGAVSRQGTVVQAAEAPISVVPAGQVTTKVAASAASDTPAAGSPARPGRDDAAVDGAGPVTRTATPARPHEEYVGDVTRLLLAAQSNGVRAGKPLDMLGATASLSWKRYLDSYAHPLPEWFKHAVSSSAAGAN